MQNIIIDKPYVPVPPYRGRIWPRILSFYAPLFLRKGYGLEKIECLHADRLVASVRAGHGVVVTPNHCRDEDPFVLVALSNACKSPFFLMASWHLFMHKAIQTFILRRAGAFSIYREGVDRWAVNTAVDILEKAERPLVLFPEGFISRTNDQLNELMEGVALMARAAAKRRAKTNPPGKVVVHPVAIRYHFQGNIEQAAAKVLDEIEARLSWQPRPGTPINERVYKVGVALLTLKELEYLGQPQTGDVHQRLSNLINSILNPMENEWVDGNHDDSVNVRVKRLRTAILPEMVNGKLDEAETKRRWKLMADVYVANQLAHYPPDYVDSSPNPQRILETVERFEEDLTDKVRVHGPMTATLTVGEAIEVNPAREHRGEDPLLGQIEAQLSQMLGISKA